MVCGRCGADGHDTSKCRACRNCLQEGHTMIHCSNPPVTKSQPKKDTGKVSQAQPKAEAKEQSSGQKRIVSVAHPSESKSANEPDSGATSSLSRYSTSFALPHREVPQPSGYSSRHELYEDSYGQIPTGETKQLGSTSRIADEKATDADVALPKNNKPLLLLRLNNCVEPNPSGQVPRNRFAKPGPPPNTSNTIGTPKFHRQQKFFASTVALETKSVWTNHYQILNIPNTIHRYTLGLPQIPAIKGRKEHRRVFLAIRDSLPGVFPMGARWASDLKTLWSLDELSVPQDRMLDNIRIQREIGGLTDPFQATLTADRGSPLSFRDVLDLSGHPPGALENAAPTPSELASAVNALVSRFAVEREDENPNGIDENYTGVTQIGANRFLVNGFCKQLSYRANHKGTPPILYANLGFTLSVRPGNSAPFINVNTITTVFYAPLRVSEFIQRMQMSNAPPRALEDMLKSVKVKICYKRGKESLNTISKQIKRISTFGEAPGLLTIDVDNVAMSVTQYFRDRLNLTLEEGNLRCVNVGSFRHPQWIPPECLQIVPGQAVRPNVLKQGEFTDQVIRVASRTPLKNRNLIEGCGLEELRLGPFTQVSLGSSSRQSDFTIWPSMVKVPSHKLRAPIIYERKNDKDLVPVNLSNKDNSWRISNRFAVPKPKIMNMAVLNLSIGQSQVQVPNVEEFAQSLAKKLNEKGISVALNPNEAHMRGAAPILVQNQEHLRERTEAVLHKCRSMSAAFAIIVIPSRNISHFQTIKYVADCIVGLPTLVSLRTNVIGSSNLNGYCNTFSLKICTRLAGPTHILDNEKSLSTIFNPMETLILGADVTHPGVGSRPGTPSIAAVVGSIDQNYMKWPGSMSIQRSRQEMISEMEGMAGQRILAWKGRNSSPLKNIVYFRDGVSESQYDEVERTEVVAIQQAYRRFFSVGVLKLTVLVCGKRHHVRFYPEDSNDEKLNVPPGTVVDRVVTHPWRVDWFLHSHFAGLGTSRSTHYVVLRNDLGVNPLDLQNFTNRLCYVWGRACKPVSLVAPAYYADILCERGRCYLQTWLSSRQEDAPTQGPHESLDEFRDRVLKHVRDRYWARENEGGARGTAITSPDSPNGPWHGALDNTMLYI